MKYHKQGFTLIELLIVIVILGILMGLVIPSVMGVLVRGKEATAQQLLTGMMTALQQYQSDRGYFPPSDSPDLNDKLCKSVNIYSAMTTRTVGQQSYFDIKPEQYVMNKGIRNPISDSDTDEVKDFFHYQEWWSKKDTEITAYTKNRYKYDLWCVSSRGMSKDFGSDALKTKETKGDTINNW